MSDSIGIREMLPTGGREYITAAGLIVSLPLSPYLQHVHHGISLYLSRYHAELPWQQAPAKLS